MKYIYRYSHASKRFVEKYMLNKGVAKSIVRQRDEPHII